MRRDQLAAKQVNIGPDQAHFLTNIRLVLTLEIRDTTLAMTGNSAGTSA